jgi:hypothetical protein
MTGFRPNRKWTPSERRGEESPAMRRLREQREKALKQQQRPPDPK